MSADDNPNELVRSKAICPLWITDFTVFQIGDLEQCNTYLETLEDEWVIVGN